MGPSFYQGSEGGKRSWLVLIGCTHGLVFPRSTWNHDFSVIRWFCPRRRACLCGDQPSHGEVEPMATPLCRIASCQSGMWVRRARIRGSARMHMRPRQRTEGPRAWVFSFSSLPCCGSIYDFAFSTRSANNFLFAVGQTVIFYFGWKLIASWKWEMQLKLWNL